MDLAIGCGYTAHAVSSQVFPSNSLIVVRIADGVSWELKAGEMNRPAWAKALGFTCDELFALVEFGDGPTGEGGHVVRIRLDSLGPGLPPDL